MKIIFEFLIIITFILTVFNFFMLYQVNKSRNNKDNIISFDIDEYINSLEFNTVLDNLIRPLLGQISNEDIAKTIVTELNKTDEKIKQIDDLKLFNYIKDVLLNYHNSYSEVNDIFLDMKEDFIKGTEEYAEEITKIQNSREDISNVLNNFYK